VKLDLYQRNSRRETGLKDGNKRRSIVRIGIIGCGKISEKHVLGYKNLSDVDIVVSDIDSNRAREFSKKFGTGYAEDIDSLLTSDKVDAIDICVPTPFHKPYIIKALEGNKHVFCEKPLCMNMDEAIEIKDVVRKTDRVLMVGYLYRFHPAFQFVKKVLDENIIGNPHFAIFRLGGRGSHMPWKHKKDNGGGAILEMMVHKLDLIVWYFEKITKSEFLINDVVIKSREIGGRKYRVNAEDLVLLDIKAGKTKILCESDLISPSYMNYIEIHGDNGSLFTSILHFMPTIVFCKEARGVFNQGNNIYNFQMENLFERELSHFIDCIKNGKRPLNSIDDSIKVFKILANASARI